MTDYSGIIQQAGQRFDVDPALISAVIQTESGGNPNAVSPAGAIGLGQIMPQTAKSLGVDPTNPAQNIMGTAAVLSQNLAKFGNVPDALRAYNGGWNPQVWNNPETQAYVGKVANAYTSAQPAPERLAQNGASGVPPTTPGGGKQAPDAFSAAFGADLPASGPAPSPATAPSSDAFEQAFGFDLTAANQPTASSGSAVGNFAHGLLRGVNDAGNSLDQTSAWIDKNVPGVQWLDSGVNNLTGGLMGATPQVTQTVLAQDAAARQAYAAKFGNSLPASLGRVAGNIGVTLPVAELEAAKVGGMLASAADSAGATTGIGRALTAASSAVTGTGAANLPGRILAASTSNAGKGAIMSAMLGGSPGSGALAGAALGPIGLAAAPVARGMALLGIKGGNVVANALGAKVAPEAIDAGATAAPDGDAAPGGADGTAPGASGADGTTTPHPAPVQDIPTSFPKAPIILTPKGADAFADKIIGQFAKGGPTQIQDALMIPGSNPTLAQATGNPGIATLERAVQSQTPQAFTMRWQGNNAARMQVISALTGTPGDIDAAMAARDASTAQAREAAFANAAPVDAQPVVDQVQQLIAQNAGRPTVQGPLEQVLGQLVPPVKNGFAQPVSDPATLYNVRKYINDIISPKVAGTAQDGRAAASQLMTILPVLDDTIESGAPGFANYIKQFSQMSAPIDGMRALQALNLYDAQGNVTLAKLDNAVRSLTKQQKAPGYRLADSITPDQMSQMVTLRDDMRREGLSNLGRSLGSNTFQNFAVNGVLNAAGSKLGHSIGAALGAVGGGATMGPAEGGIGALLAYGASHMAGKVSENAHEMVMDALVRKLLNPQDAATALQAVAGKARPGSP